MRFTLIVAAIAGLVIGCASPQNQNPPVYSAQNQNPPANQGPGNPAVRTTDGNNAGAPVAGANSFTEGQAKARIESRGYSNVTNLTKDGTGVWRGKAQKDSIPVDISLDFQGNVIAR